jgi:hypothetical protein
MRKEGSLVGLIYPYSVGSNVGIGVGSTEGGQVKPVTVGSFVGGM